MKISLHKETKASEFEIVCLTNVKRWLTFVTMSRKSSGRCYVSLFATMNDAARVYEGAHCSRPNIYLLSCFMDIINKHEGKHMKLCVRTSW